MDETQTNAVGPLYRVNYTFVTGLGALRTASLVIEAPNVEAANSKAASILATSSHRHTRIVSTKEY